VGPDAPFGGFPIGLDELADPASTGQVMKFIVGTDSVTDNSAHPSTLALPAITPLPAPSNTRQVSLNEEMYEAADIPVAALLGTYNSGTDTNTPLLWMAPVTENPALNTVEEWQIFNFTEDAHPIHVHLVMFQVLGRGVDGTTQPESWESGWKDTVIAYPGEITRIRARFDIQGLFVWHCHIVEHEDNEMMRPYAVGAFTMPAGVELRRFK